MALIFDKIPESSIEYVNSIIQNEDILIILKKNRKTKHGDFSVNKKGIRKITINSDLNPYRFLITLLHEISHLFVFNEYGFNIKPHGIEWKNKFKNLLLPVLNNHIFPEQILKPLARYTLNPKASTDSDHKLSYALNQFNFEKKNYISDLKINSMFTLKNGREYIFLKKLRKRYQCREIQTNRIYLFNPNAEIII
tara:strand:+ start:790 stop:1374 length:585 start_codon:yes stop_codon:yes gene_type:complete